MHQRPSLAFVVVLMVVTAMSSSRSFADTNESSGSKYGKIELLRDKWGVPHVFAETDAGAMYGLGFATAEDRGFQMHYTLRIIEGRLAELIGDVGKVRRRETAVENDRKMRTFGFERAAKQRIAELDNETVGLLEAFSEGVNDAFEKEHPQRAQQFDRVGLVPEKWKPSDCLLSWWHLAQFFATDGTRDLNHWRNLTQPQSRHRPGAQGGRAGLQPPDPARRIPQDDRAAVVQRHHVSQDWLNKADEFLRQHGYDEKQPDSTDLNEPGPKFSHAWVADGEYSGTGSAVLVSMPQTPVANPSLLYEFHIRGKTFDTRGVGVAGSPVILIGWNSHVAWGMTALGADQADLFRLKTDSAHAGQYEFDGQWKPLKEIHEEIKVKDGPTEKLVIRETHFGPVASEFAFKRPSDPDVALKRIPMCDAGNDTIKGALAMFRSRSVDDFVAGLDKWRFPTANVLVGDDQGNIGYATVGALPLRSPLSLADGGAAHDGSASKYDWRAIIPQTLVPTVTNPASGFLFSGNHRPIGSFYPIPLGISTGSMGDSLRSWRLRQLFGSNTSMTQQQLVDMFRDTTNPARQAIVRIGYHVIDQLQRNLSPDATSALKRLRKWFADGASSSLDSQGSELATMINTQFRFVTTDLAAIYGGGESGLSYFLKTMNTRIDADDHADIDEQVQQYIDRLLAEAWREAKATYGDDCEQWNGRARAMAMDQKLAYCGSLDGFPSIDRERDMPLPPLRCVDGATVFSQAAQAYVQAVPLHDVDSAQSLLPPGNSESPDSPSYRVNIDGWIKGELHAAPLSRSAIEPYVVRRRVLAPK